MKEMPPGTHLLFVGIQAILDVALLVLAFIAFARTTAAR